MSPLGAFAEGRRHGEEALRLATLEGRGLTPTIVHRCLGYLYLDQGDLEHAIWMLDQGLALCRASGNRVDLRPPAAGLGYASALQGRLAEGCALLEEAVSESIRTGARRASTRRGSARSVVWGDMVQRPGSTRARHSHLARRQKTRGFEAHALHQLGVVYAHADLLDAEQAEAHYRQALTLAEERGMRPLQAHCHRGLGTLYAKTGQREQARTVLATAIDLYRAMDMTFWLPQTEAALAQVEGR